MTSIKNNPFSLVFVSPLVFFPLRSSKVGEGGEDLSFTEAPQHRWAEGPGLKIHGLIQNYNTHISFRSLVVSRAMAIHHPDTVMRWWEKETQSVCVCVCFVQVFNDDVSVCALNWVIKRHRGLTASLTVCTFSSSLYLKYKIFSPFFVQMTSHLLISVFPLPLFVISKTCSAVVYRNQLSKFMLF